MSARFNLDHIESCMGGRYQGMLFKLEEYRERMQVGQLGRAAVGLVAASPLWSCSASPVMFACWSRPCILRSGVACCRCTATAKACSRGRGASVGWIDRSTRFHAARLMKALALRGPWFARCNLSDDCESEDLHVCDNAVICAQCCTAAACTAAQLLARCCVSGLVCAVAGGGCCGGQLHPHDCHPQQQQQHGQRPVRRQQRHGLRAQPIATHDGRLS